MSVFSRAGVQSRFSPSASAIRDVGIDEENVFLDTENNVRTSAPSDSAGGPPELDLSEL